MLAGRSLPHAAMMMIPEAYRDREDLPDYLKGFYAFHSCLMEPWDGPASVAFTDGRVVGATLDRNGLRPGPLGGDDRRARRARLGGRPARHPPAEVRRLGRLQPGKLFLVDLERGRIVEDEEVKREVSTRRPYGEWYARNAVRFAELPPSSESDALRPAAAPAPARLRLLPGGPAGAADADGAGGAEPVGSMGNDLALAVLSDQAPPLFSYFKQLFAQVTNPPIDPIREEIVMSLATSLGNERNLFDETPEHAHKLLLDQPILLNRELETLRHVEHDVYAARTIDITWPIAEGPAGMVEAIDRICLQATRGDRRRRQHHHPLRPPARPAPRAGAVAAGGGRRPPPPGARGHAPARRDHRRVRRAPRGAPLRDADRLRRERDQPLPDARDARRAGRRRAHRARRRRRLSRFRSMPRRPPRTSSKRSAKGC